MKPQVAATLVLLFLFSLQTNAQQNNKLRYPGASLRLLGGSSIMSSDISSEARTTGGSGSGAFNATTPNTIGSLYGFSTHYELNTLPLELFARYMIFNVDHQDVSSTSPSKFNHKHTRTELGFWFNDHSETDKGFFKGGLSVFYEFREAQTPITPSVLNNASVWGPAVMIGYTDWISRDKFFFESELYLGFVNGIKESPDSTGAYNYGGTVKINIEFVYPYTDHLDLALGLWTKYDLMAYTGASTRGGQNSKETHLVFGVPAQLRFRF